MSFKSEVKGPKE